MANEKNLKPLDKRTKREQREIQTKGGVASGQKRREQTAIRELAAIIFGMPMKKGKFTKADELAALSDIKGRNVSAATAAMVKIAQKAAKGDLRAAKLWLEMSGDMRQNVNLSGEIEVKRDLSKLDDGEMAVLAGLVAKANTDGQ